MVSIKRSTGAIALALWLVLPVLAQPAPEVRPADLKTIQGILKSNRGHVVLVYFFATWCPPCAQEIPDLVILQNRYGAKGLQTVGIGLDEPASVAAKVVPYLNPLHINFPVYVATGDNSAVFRWFSPSWVGQPPSAFVYNRKGTLVHEFHERRSLSDYEGVVGELL